MLRLALDFLGPKHYFYSYVAQEQKEAPMIKVIIERTIADGLEPNYHEAIRHTLKAVLDAPGYISSESLTDAHHPSHRVIITNWTSIAAWEQWHSSDARQQVIGEIAPILEGPEKVTILEAR